MLCYRKAMGTKFDSGGVERCQNVLRLEKSATMKYPPSGTVGVIPTSSRNFAILSRFGRSSVAMELW